jgi:hypothetical protein
MLFLLRNFGVYLPTGKRNELTMLISVAIKLLLIFIIPILASSVPLEIGYISTGSQLSDPELDIAVQAIKKVEELKILPGISLSFKVIVGEPLLHNVSTSFVALFGASSNLKYVKVVTNEWTKPIIIHVRSIHL